jgi:hypothetical protein
MTTKTISIMILMRTFDKMDIGEMSPYPTVATVVVAMYSDSKNVLEQTPVELSEGFNL